MRFLRLHSGLIGYLLLAVGIVIGFYFLNQTRVALCNLRVDLAQRIESQQESINQGVKFLCPPSVQKKLGCHPPREGGFGLTKDELIIATKTQLAGQRRALENSKRTRTALGSLYCGKGA